MVRGKNNGLHGESGDKADTLNLLDSTDSDVEWLNLPPIKGKRPKKLVVSCNSSVYSVHFILIILQADQFPR